MSQFKSVLLIEKTYLIQAGLESVISELPGFIVAKSFSGEEVNLAVLIEKQNPDLVIVNPASLNGSHTLFLNYIDKKCNCIVLGLMPKDTAKNIKSHFKEIIFFSDNKLEIQKKIQDQFKRFYPEENKSPALSKREITILKQVVLGLTNQQIADKLFISVHTVTTHRKNINRKLGIKTVSGLMVYALMNNIVSLDDLGDNF